MGFNPGCTAFIRCGSIESERSTASNLRHMLFDHVTGKIGSDCEAHHCGRTALIKVVVEASPATSSGWSCTGEKLLSLAPSDSQYIFSKKYCLATLMACAGKLRRYSAMGRCRLQKWGSFFIA